MSGLDDVIAAETTLSEVDGLNGRLVICGYTLDQLAGAAGVSRRMVVNVEQGAANPSVGTLLRISDALGVGLPSLVEQPQPKPVRVTRRGEGAVLWSGESGGRGVLVAGTEPPEVVELWEYISDRLEKNFRRTVFAAPGAAPGISAASPRPVGGFGRRVVGQ